jgi:SAM-dependent methyltransferase
MTPPLIDRLALALKRRRALGGTDAGAAVLLDWAAADLADRVTAVHRRFGTAVAFGDATSTLVRALHATGQVETLVRADFLAAGGGAPAPDLVTDDERLPFADNALDLFVSALTLQWANDLPGALIQIRRSLRPDGLFLATLLGGDTLTELREALRDAEAELTGGISPRVLPFAEVRDLGALLQRAGFALPVADQDRLTLRYDSALHLMRDLKAMGAGNVLAERQRTPPPARLLLRAAEIYAERFSDPDGRVRATFTLVSLSGWVPHESQQKPLRPGSAKTSLADALKGARGESRQN